MYPPQQSPPFAEIAHPTDLQEDGEIAFAHAVRVALAAHANLSIVHVSRTPKQIPWQQFPGVRDLLHRWGVVAADADSEAVTALGLGVTKVQIRSDHPASAVLYRIDKQGTDLIVLATHRRTGLDRWLHREVARPIARSAGAMTLFVPNNVAGFVARDSGRIQLERVLIPVASEPSPQPAIAAASALLNLLESGATSLHLLHVGQPNAFPQVELPVRQGWEWTREITAGDVVEQIEAVANEFQPQLIALTTSGRHGFLDMLRGSITERLLGVVKCPVLAVPIRHEV